MTFPVYFHLFGWSIHAHQVLELLAYTAGFQLYLWLRRRWPKGPKLTVEQTAWIVVGVIFGALLGARVLSWAEMWPAVWVNRADWQVWLGGKTIVGAMLGGWVGVEIVKRRMGLSHPSGDIYVFPVILGMCIGRIGCFLEGPGDGTWGLPTSLPWGVPALFGDPPTLTPLHPAPLYEIIFLLALAGVFLWRIKSGRQRGCMFSQFVFGYLAWRLGVEFIKPVQALPYVHLSAIQVAAVLGMGYAVWHWNDACCGSPPSDGLTTKNTKSTKNQDCPPPPTTLATETQRAQRTHRDYEDECCGDGRACGGEDGVRVLELTNSLCGVCLRKVEGKITVEGGGGGGGAGKVFMQKFCPEHGVQRVLVADDAGYWRRSRSLMHRPGTVPKRRNTELRQGCPWDCGLCPDHEQHTCLAIVEITEQCDLGCPICYAAATGAGRHRTVAEVERMLDAVVANEGEVAVVQISGGEPTLHPDFFAILDAARRRPIRHLMINSNGLRMAEDAEFVARLAGYKPALEVYLQFDSLRAATLRELRGRDLSAVRRAAVVGLGRQGISTTLVVALKKGVNDREIGEILDFAIGQPSVRGVTFQPIQAAGRLGGFDPAVHRLTLTEVRRAILEQHSLFTPQDIVPVPCHGDALAMGYALRQGGKMIPLSRVVDPAALLATGGDTICYEQDAAVREEVRRAMLASPLQVAQALKLECCLPLLPKKGSPIPYERVFRVIIMAFMDAWGMDLRSLKRSCVHIVDADGRLVPFETMNVLHRRRQLSVVSGQ